MVVIAHQGGWDEILMVLAPVALFAGLLWLANKRANERVGHPHAPAPGTDDDPTDPD